MSQWRTNKRSGKKFPMSLSEANLVVSEMGPEGFRIGGISRVRGDSDPVIFRKWPDGSIIAILPHNTAGRGMVMMYEHVGQHGEGRPEVVMSGTTMATSKEYYPLLYELIRMGYSPVVHASEELEMLMNEREEVE